MPGQPMLELYIITGSSRGLGAAMAEQVLAPGVRLLGMARGIHPGLEAKAAARQAQVEQFAIDLEQAPLAAQRLQQWLEAQPAERVGRATLVNNAAVLAASGPLELSDSGQISRVIRVGTEAPILLTAAFLRVTRHWRAARRVLMISSGAGRHAMVGAASYCASKAALDHFARAVALDEARLGIAGAQIVSLAPGVIDTDMQTELRRTDPEVFANRQFFVDLHERGQLLSPSDAATRVLAYLDRQDFGSQPVADVRQP